MKKTFTLLIVLFALSLSAWAQTTVTWDEDDVASLQVGVHYGYVPQTQTIDDITITAYAPTSGDYCHFLTPSDDDNSININFNGKLTFAPKSGKLTRIVISLEDDGIANPDSLPKNSGWSYNSFFKQLYWIGSAASTVALTGNGSEQGIYFSKIQSVEFTVVPATGTVVTWDADILDDVNLSMDEGTPGDNVSQTFLNITASVEALANGDVSNFYTPLDGTPWIHIVKGGKLTFAPTSGNLTNIVISCAELPTNPENLKAESGWTWDISTMRLTWSGDAASSVDLECDATSNGFYFNNITSVVYTVVSGSTPVAPATTTITWESSECESVQIASRDGGGDHTLKTIKGITATAVTQESGDYCHFVYDEHITSITAENGGKITFTSSVGEITRIVISSNNGSHTNIDNVSAGWTWDYLADELVWTGEAASSVVLACNGSTGDFYFRTINTIEFTVLSDGTIDPTPVDPTTLTTITWNASNGLKSINIEEYTNNYFSGNGPYSNNYGTKTATIEGVTATMSATADGSYASLWTYENTTYISLHDGGKLTFSTESGQFTSIVINYDEYNGSGNVDSQTDWSSDNYALTWSGDATNSVVLANASVSNITSIVFTLTGATPIAPDPTPSVSTITWDQNEVITVNVDMSSGYTEFSPKTIDGITVSANAPASGDYCHFSTGEGGTTISLRNGGTLIFTPASGLLTRIVISCNVYQQYDHPENLAAESGWTYSGGKLTWSGNAASSVVLACNGSSDGVYFRDVTSIEFTVVENAPASSTTITWDEQDVNSLSLSCNDIEEVQTSSEIDGITASLMKTGTGDHCSFNNNKDLWITNNCGKLTFTSSVGNISGIVLHAGSDVYTTPYNLSSGWTWDDVNKTLTWAGTAAESVTLSGSMDFIVASIVFSVVNASSTPVDPDPTPTLITSTVTWYQNDVASIDARPDNPYVGVPGYQILKGISVTANAPQSGDNCHFMTAYNNTSISAENGGTVSFAPLAGKLTKIVITCTGYADYSDLSSAWTWNGSTKELTWSGNATQSVALACEGSSGYIFFGEIYSIEFTVVTEEAPANPFIIWEQRQVNHVELNSYTKDYIDAAPVIRNIIATLTRTNSNEGNCIFEGGRIAIGGCGTLEFKSIVGELSSIVITCSSVTSASDLSTGWTYNSGAKTLTWEGSTAADEVTLSGDIDCKVTSIKFFYTPAAAPRLGEQFRGIYDQLYQITGAQTAMMPVQQITHTLEVPETVDYEGVTYYVTEVADNAFKNNKLPNAYIGANVGRIGAHAFEGCTIMSDISIYSHVVDEIGEQAYKDCKLMQIFECYTKQPPVLGSNAFDGDGRINHILVQYDTEVAYKSADGWINLADKVEEMSNAPYIGEIFFFNNQKTVNLYQVLALPDYFTSTNGQAKVVPYTAEVNAIYPRTLESTLVVPEEVSYVAGMKYSVTGVGANAYKNCTEVEVVLFPEGVTSIEAGAFAGCTEVMNVFFLWKDPTIVTWADANVGAEFATAASGKTKIIVPKDKLAEYQAWAPAWASCMIAGEIEDVEATKDPNSYGTSARYYRTFYDSTKDYMLPPSVWAHAGYVRGNEFILRPVAFDGEILPKGTAVVLESETAEYRLIAMENSSVPAYTGPNDLVGLDVAQTVSYVADSLNITEEQIYVLNRRATVGGELQVGMGMYRYTGTTLGAKKAFMVLRNPVDTGTSNDQPAPGRFLFRHEDTATSFENVQTDNDLCTKILRDGQLIIIRDGKEYNAQGMIIK